MISSQAEFSAVVMGLKIALEYKCTKCGRDCSTDPKSLQFCHINRKRFYTIGEIIRKRFDKPSQKRFLFCNSISICYIMCRACHDLYDLVKSGKHVAPARPSPHFIYIAVKTDTTYRVLDSSSGLEVEQNELLLKVRFWSTKSLTEYFPHLLSSK